MKDAKEPFVRLSEENGFADVWLEPVEGVEHHGLCLGCGDSKVSAIADARRALSDAAQQLERLEREG